MDDIERKILYNALDAAITALDDWTNTYAPDFCNDDRVKEARQRLNENGTLFYIAAVVEKCREARNYNTSTNL